MQNNLYKLACVLAGLTLQGNAIAAVPLAKNTLYMCEYKSNSSLYKINPSNGAATLVGPTQTSLQCTDLTFRGTTLLGSAFTKLLTIDPTTGKATPKSKPYGGSITDINALVTQPSTNKLFGAGSNSPGRFVQINPTSGVATQLGTFGTGLGSAGDLAFLNGVLYATLTNAADTRATYLAKISLVSPTIGKATLIGPIRRTVNGKTVYLQNVWGLAVRNNVLFGAMLTGEVLTINPNNAVATLKGDNNKQQAGLAVSPP